MNRQANFPNGVVLSFKSLGADMKMKRLVILMQQKKTFQIVTGRTATYLLICPKRLNAFYADVASQPTTVHYYYRSGQHSS